ncbi:MAG: haloacid dehalogenase, partial [Candidatus Eremiobacteraeota bacterium]|nr:haloacid dehalogenase [Candidatus Eremiobacteraeota bacterium]
MSADIYINLSWLLRAPADFRQRCRSIADAAEPAREIWRLANYAMDEPQMRQLASAIEKLRASDASLAPLIPFRLGLVGNATLDHLIPVLTATAARHGINLECVKADFGQTLQAALDAHSAINRAKPDAVLLALDYRGLPFQENLHNDSIAAQSVQDAVAFITAMRDGFQSHSGALSIVQTIAPQPETTFGSLDRAVAGTQRALAQAFNAALIDSIRNSQDTLLDVASL